MHATSVALPGLLLLVAGASPPTDPLASPRPEAAALRQAGRERAAPPPAEPFEGGLAEARALAVERNVPLLVVSIFESEPWEPEAHYDVDDLRKALLADPAFASLLERAVLALACNRVHPREQVEVGEGEARELRQRCASYHTAACAAHQRLFDQVYGAFQEDGALRSPCIVIEAPGGRTAARWSDGRTPPHAEVLAALGAAQRDAGPGLSSDEHGRVVVLRARALERAREGLHGEAWHAWQALLALTETTPSARAARSGSEAALSALRELGQAAHRAVAAEQPIEAWELLTRLASQAVGTPLDKEAARQLASLERDQRFRDVLRQHRRAKEAERLLNEVDALVRAGEEPAARRSLSRLLRRFGDTPAARTARERWPHLAGG